MNQQGLSFTDSPEVNEVVPDSPAVKRRKLLAVGRDVSLALPVGASCLRPSTAELKAAATKLTISVADARRALSVFNDPAGAVIDGTAPREAWVWGVFGPPAGIFFGEIAALDCRDALSLAMMTNPLPDKTLAEIFRVPISVLNEISPATETFDHELGDVKIRLRKRSLASFDPPAEWKPAYSPWRHDGWYVLNARYPRGSCGCISRNYADGKWRIACDGRRGEKLGDERDFTFRSRDEAARAEYALTKMVEAGLYPGSTY